MLRVALSLYFLCCFLRSFCDDRFVNVALHKVCEQSSFWDSSHPANYAVNGNTEGAFYKQPNCIHTAGPDTSPWWQVNLGRPYPVYSITVWARGGTLNHTDAPLDRMSNRIITVDGKECYRFGQVAPSSPREMKVNCTTPDVNGTVVRVTRDPGSDGDENAIMLCEVQVYSCSARYWGSGCVHDCGKCRYGAACDKVTGECGCEPGWMPPMCIQLCPSGTFGENCAQKCSENCRTCNNTNGQCTCKPGWTPPTCFDDFMTYSAVKGLACWELLIELLTTQNVLTTHSDKTASRPAAVTVMTCVARSPDTARANRMETSQLYWRYTQCISVFTPSLQGKRERHTPAKGTDHHVPISYGDSWLSTLVADTIVYYVLWTDWAL